MQTAESSERSFTFSDRCAIVKSRVELEQQSSCFTIETVFKRFSRRFEEIKSADFCYPPSFGRERFSRFSSSVLVSTRWYIREIGFVRLAKVPHFPALPFSLSLPARACVPICVFAMQQNRIVEKERVNSCRKRDTGYLISFLSTGLTRGRVEGGRTRGAFQRIFVEKGYDEYYNNNDKNNVA